MKNLKYLLSLIVLTVALTAQAQADAIPDIVAGFNSGYSDAIAEHLNDNVELVIKNANNVFTKQQTKNILTDFFKKNPPLKFTIMHRGDKENAQFVIGNLETTNGTYRVYFLIKKNLVQQLRIEGSND
ncbi:MAG TPA: DUF4783 domain-containing protein [Paludibacteraceae bacterium]|nr:DUF4783 domain-containing protein [Paludibacteraceae bacterium]